MKKTYFTVAIIIIIILINLVSTVWNNGNQVMSYSTGAPTGVTGSPGDGFVTCTSCHAGPAATAKTGWITSNIPGTGYIPNTTYTVTATATAAGHTKFGFEISPQNVSGTLLGTLINTSAQTQILFGNKYITHTSGGTTGTTGFHTWSFNWTAPASGTGAVTFYAAFNITNANNASTGDTIYTSTMTVQENTSLMASATITNNVSCNGGNNGSATALATGGSSPYSYLWNSSPSQTTSASTALSAGTYTVTITDASSNTATSSVTVTQPSALTVNTTQTNVSCNAGANGHATATASGGTGTLSYAWNTSPVQHTAAATGLSSSTYTVTVTDAHSCTITASVIITQPTALTIVTSHTDISCNGGSDGSITITVGGGTAPFSYIWSGPQTNDFAGIYTVTVTDANGCSQTTSVTLTEPSPISIGIVSQTNISCNGTNDGSFTITTISGGSPPYHYLWSTSQTTSTISNLSAGSYMMTISDAHNCSASSSFIITEPTAISAGISSTNNVTCNGGNNGTATVTVAGGTSAYTYLWNTSPVQSAATATALSNGTYTVTIIDAHGCTITASASVTQPSPIIVTTSSATPVCAGGCDTLISSTSGGNGNFTYSWQPSGSTTNAIVACPLTTTTYTLIVTDSSGCIGSDYTTLTVHQLPIVSITLNPDTVCTNASYYLLTGGLPAGGSYAGDGVSAGYFNPGFAGAGSHFITYVYTDSNSCTNSDSVNIYVDICTGINSLSYLKEIKIFPNPGNGMFSIESAAGGYDVTILSSYGKIVYSQQIMTEKSAIDLKNEPSGIYFLLLKTADGIVSKKLVIY